MAALQAAPPGVVAFRLSCYGRWQLGIYFDAIFLPLAPQAAAAEAAVRADAALIQQTHCWVAPYDGSAEVYSSPVCVRNR